MANCFHPQRDDKVALFKVLRDDMERIKAGTLDMEPIRIVCLWTDGQ